MNIDEKVAVEIYNEIIIDLIKSYKDGFNKGNGSRYDFINSFYNSLDEDKKKEFILFLDSLAMNVTSIILGGFDGSTKLGKFFGGFSVMYENQEITPFLQDNFLGIYEDDFHKKVSSL